MFFGIWHKHPGAKTNFDDLIPVIKYLFYTTGPCCTWIVHGSQFLINLVFLHCSFTYILTSLFEEFKTLWTKWYVVYFCRKEINNLVTQSLYVEIKKFSIVRRPLGFKRMYNCIPLQKNAND
jgi:hypothetical protein